jgi:rhamnosyl/mannosyltransferase
LEHLVRAAPHIRTRVVAAGDGPERAKCRALARKLGVDICFPGELAEEDLVAHLHGCAVFAFPSVARSEAFGISILEAHACGKPVVATRLGTGVEYANLHGQTGLNVAPGDALAFAEAVNTLLADPERRQRMGTRARARVEAEFTADRVARAEFALYQEVLECSPTRT